MRWRLVDQLMRELEPAPVVGERCARAGKLHHGYGPMLHHGYGLMRIDMRDR
jgi:hypothetical protein